MKKTIVVSLLLAVLLTFSTVPVIAEDNSDTGVDITHDYDVMADRTKVYIRRAAGMDEDGDEYKLMLIASFPGKNAKEMDEITFAIGWNVITSETDKVLEYRKDIDSNIWIGWDGETPSEDESLIRKKIDAAVIDQ